jgi:hypothetical protein
MMVMVLMVAMVDSSRVPPIDPLRILFVSQSEVLTRSTSRIRTPRMKNIAKVARHAPMTGSHPAVFLANTKPRATLIVMKTAARYGERVFSDRKERMPESSAEAAAEELPSSAK